MQKNDHRKNGKAKIIPFERDGAFFLRRGSQRLEKNDLWEAVFSYRQACKREPKNVEYQLALAEVLTEMHRYEQSNRLLFPLLSKEGRPAECYFGMACNFIGQMEFNYAKDSLESYLQMDPEGPFSYDAIDMLDAIENEDYEMFSINALSEREWEAQDVCDHCRKLMEYGEADRAVEEMEAAAAKYPELLFVKNNLAMAYFCKKQFAKATRIAKEVIESDAQNIQAHCNLVIFGKAQRNNRQVEDAFRFLREQVSDDPDDLNRMGVTFLELKQYEDALRALKRLKGIFPYDEGTLHRMGVCYYCLGDYAKARDCYDRLLKIDMDDTVAMYYRTRCQKALAGDKQPLDWMNNYQVPYSEVLARIRTINSFTKLKQEELTHKWVTEHSFRRLLQWGLQLPEPVAKRALLALMANIGGEEAENTLRWFLLDGEQPDEIKREVFMLLLHMGAQEPYMAMMDGELVQSKANLFSKVPENLPSAYQRVLRELMESMAENRPPACIEAASGWFERYIASFEDRYPKLPENQVHALAAAIEYLACKEAGESDVSKTAIAARYGISLVRFNNALTKLILAQEED